MKTASAILSLIIFSLFISLPSTSFSETLNPEGTNPHAVNKKKKITEEQKKAAWEAKIKKGAGKNLKNDNQKSENSK